MFTRIKTIATLLAFVNILSASSLPAQEIKTIPFPKNCQKGSGSLVLDSDCPIIAEDESLLPLANVAAEEMTLLFGAKAHLTRDKPASAGIELKIDKNLKKESYQIDVSDRVVIRGGSYQGVAWGLVTLLQTAEADQGKVVVPRMKIADEPYAPYRGLEIDLARRWHPIETVKQAVVLCHWYKIGYLQLHLTDNESWTFPSKAYSKLATPGRQYTLEQLRDLESFANARGVAIVPEIEMPGHSGIICAALREEVGNEPFSSIAMCPGRESTYKVLDTIVGEVCEVFKATPYFHIGADEVNKTAWASCKHCIDYRKRHDIENDEELYRHFIVRMNEIVKKHGKRTIVWEGFKVQGKIPVPKDITVMEFESLYELPQNYVAAGYSVINAAWQPLYVVNGTNWPPEKIFSWNMYRWEHWLNFSKAYPNGIDVPESPLVLGAEMCSWEQPATIEIPSLRERLAAMSERLWDHKTRRTFSDFSARLKAADAKLTKLLPQLAGK
jgi:hexosaminidase